MALLLFSSAAQCLCNTTSNYVLLMDFYATTTGWINSSGWGNTSVPICNWYGISCSGKYIADIILPSNGITGTLPPSWGNLTQLQQLDLDGNGLSGHLPPLVGQHETTSIFVP